MNTENYRLFVFTKLQLFPWNSHPGVKPIPDSQPISNSKIEIDSGPSINGLQKLKGSTRAGSYEPQCKSVVLLSHTLPPVLHNRCINNGKTTDIVRDV
jgi:hypothetical protein